MSGEQASFTPAVQKKLEETFLRIQNSAAVAKLYEMLTPAEQQKVDEQSEELFGKESHKLFNRTIGMWMLLRGVSQVRAIIDAGFYLNFLTPHVHEWLLRETRESVETETEGSVETETVETAEEAAANRELVLDEMERIIYWNGEEVNVDWRRRPALWNFLFLLAERAKSGGSVDVLTFGRVSPGYISKTKSHLRNRVPGFPQDLAARVMPEGSGNFRLDVLPQEIGIFQTEVTESVKEVVGSC